VTDFRYFGFTEELDRAAAAREASGKGDQT
jgi:hypothetical protein